MEWRTEENEKEEGESGGEKEVEEFQISSQDTSGWLLSAYFLGGYGEDGRGMNGLSQAVIAAAKSRGLGIPSDRLHKVLEFVSTVHDLCDVLRMDFFSTVTEVHPSLNDSTGVQSKNISNDTLSRLAKTVSALEEDKEQRLHKLQDLATQLTDLWNLIDTSEEERSLFDHITCSKSPSVDEVTIPGALALDLIEQAEVGVERLDQLKASMMKEIAFKRQAELEEIYARAHIEIDREAACGKIMALIDSGNVEPSELLSDMDN